MWAEAALNTSLGDDHGSQLPTGTVTFLLSDIEGSTRLWSEFPEAMPEAVSRVYAIFDEAVARHVGVRPVEQGEGDSVVAAFSRATDAVGAAFEAQRRLHSEQWPDGMTLWVRIALHTAEAQLRDSSNYFGIAMSRCARIRAIAPGGQTLLSRSVRDLALDGLPEDVALLDCGEHRLRDLGRPEQIFTLVHPELPVLEPGQLRSLDVLPNNLPSQLSSFVGRERELDELKSVLEETRMLTLTGAGGSGKTRLALALAARSLREYSDGVWWVELAAVADPALVVEAIAEPFGIRPLPGMTSLQAVCGGLAQKRALLVLDNCEHLLDECAEATIALLESCGDLKVLATSRAPLGVAAESAWRVPPLALPEKPEEIEALSQYDAVKLFIERATKVRSNFKVTNENAAALAQICADVDGIPLAIELAAARVRMLSLEQIAAGLADRFHLLTGGARAALPRQQTIRASVEWSHDLLSDQERTLFRRLGVFAGGFTLDAAEAVCADEQLDRYSILDLLTALVDKSLVLTVERGQAIRYGMLETFRQYALERLDEVGEHDVLRDRHLTFFASLANEAEPFLLSLHVDQWLTVIDAEEPNLAAAFEHALGADPVIALRMTVALTFYWTFRGRFSESEAAYVAALAAVPEPSVLRARALWGRSWMRVRAGDFQPAVEIAQDAVALAEQCDDDGTAARALDMIGASQMFVDPAAAIETQQRALALAKAAGDDWAIVDSSQNLGFAYLIQDREEETIEAFESVYPIISRLGLSESECWHWFAMGWFGWMRGDRTRLRGGMERVREISLELDEPLSLGCAVALLTIDDTDHGGAETGLAEATECAAQMAAVGSGLALSYLMRSVAYAQAALGLLDAAETAFAQLDVQEQGMLAAWDQFSLSWRARAARLVGDLERAAKQADKALELSSRTGNQAIGAAAKLERGRIAAARGELGAAESEIHDAIGLALAHDFSLILPDALAALAVVAAGLGSHEEAARLLGASDRALEDLGDRTRWSDEEAELDRLRVQLESEVGPEPYAEGRELSLENAIGWARRARGQRKRPERGWESLTPTELQVVELVAQGLTNPQIGQRMFISSGTVKVHLSHIFAKLGTSTRSELAAEATRRGS
jgi:predicted ATPase/class 3 adenylate cyclase/DNA-binding CsgD family transcriptional regulator